MRMLNVEEIAHVSGGADHEATRIAPVLGNTAGEWDDTGTGSVQKALEDHALDIAAGAGGIAGAAACAPTFVGQLACGTAAIATVYAAPAFVSSAVNYIESGLQSIGHMIESAAHGTRQGPSF